MNHLEPKHKLEAVWEWLTKTSVGLSEPARRRARVMAVISLIMLGLIAAFLPLMFFVISGMSLGLYLVLIGGTLCLCGLAFILNRLGYYTAAATVLVACTIPGPWFAIFSNLYELSANIIAVIYVIPSIILGGFLLSARATTALSAIQLAVLFMFALLGYVPMSSTWIGLLSFVSLIGVLLIVTGRVSRQDLDQIDRQTEELKVSHAQLRELSVRDALTGLFNRRYLEETLTRELGRAEREQSSLGVIMVDVDYFKRFNDAHGHAAGDALLRQISASLRDHIRSSDVACRYGGDELTLVLPNSSLEVTLHRAEILCEGARNVLLEYEHRYLEPITISLGVAMFPQDGVNADEVLKAADDALYYSKQHGRNRVSMANFKRSVDASTTPLPRLR